MSWSKSPKDPELSMLSALSRAFIEQRRNNQLGNGEGKKSMKRREKEGEEEEEGGRRIG